ncbi:MAG: hypothetical protein ISF22_07195 [Methanomassiliicoccus sp.]|nr:hypothetical protein [Methanomassiliicoccus sp.]
MNMKRRNAMIAAVIGVVIIAAAAGGFLLMNPSTNTANVESQGSNDIRPTGPAGSVSGMEINTATMNRSNASAFTELRAEFNATPVRTIPDTLVKVAVTNNHGDNITLNCSNFTAVLDNGNSTNALNNDTITIASNATWFFVLGFMTNGTNISSIGYDDGNISFPVDLGPQGEVDIPPIVTMEAPTGNMTSIKDLNFTTLAAWNISMGEESPMPLRFINGSVVLALVAVTNNNTTSVSLSPSDFWLDGGNGTWVQADVRFNNNVPTELGNNTTIPFLLGFRLAENMTAGNMYYWPGQGNMSNVIPLERSELPKDPRALALRGIWDVNTTMDANRSSMNGNQTNMTNMTTLAIQLMALGNDTVASDFSNFTIWTMHNGTMKVIPVNSSDDRNITMMVDMKKGDNVTLLSYSVGGDTRYIWLRSLKTTA